MRVSLARAIYSNREILLLDDIVSAVDANIAEFIIKVALRGFLRGKTILLATHAVRFA
jgi:ATP-binding cassette subfamily C (CFTR/MRP) protein 1